MKRLLPALLLLGYIGLVPYCFLSTPLHGMEHAGTHTPTSHTHHSSPASDCGMPGMACAGAGGSMKDALSHHYGMYTSITGTLLATSLTLLALLFVAVLFILLPRTLPREGLFLVSSRVHPKRRKVEMPGILKDLTHWLALSETSPTFAFAT